MREDRDQLQELDAGLAPVLTATGGKTRRRCPPFNLRGLQARACASAWRWPMPATAPSLLARP